MLAKADMKVEVVASELARFGVEAAYLVPTPTGLSKSIMDAHEYVQSFLKTKGLHDFESQGQGQDNKRKIPIKLISSKSIIELELSLYRPNTKNGDPRMWISDLKNHVHPYNLIALIVGSKGALYAINCSDPEVWNSRLISDSPLRSLLTGLEKSEIASELLEKLFEVSARGYVDSLRTGPTGVGYTLETLLGISANSSRSPNYKGIELKSGRTPSNGKQKTRSTLFSKIPNWDLSEMKSGGEILRSFEYISKDKNRLQLYCSVSNKPNTQGLQLRVEASGNHIEAIDVRQIGMEEPVVRWLLSEVQESLALKHKETFWIKAHQRVKNGQEQIHFTEVAHTRSPLVNNFGILIDSGKIELDFTLSEKSGGGTRDHGYLFKIWRENFDLLFPKPINYVLSV